MTRYMKQVTKGAPDYVRIWAPIADKRKDLMEISEAEALELLKEQVKTRQQKMREGTFVEPTPEPIEETGVVDEEAKVDMTEPETPEDMKADSGDSEIKMLENIRVVGKGKARIESYMLEKYGINVDRRFKLNELVDQAIAARNRELVAKAEEVPEEAVTPAIPERPEDSPQ